MPVVFVSEFPGSLCIVNHVSSELCPSSVVASLGKSFSKYGRTGQRASGSCVRDGDGVSSRLVGTRPLGLSPSPCQDLAQQWERDKEEMCKTESRRGRIQVWLKGRKHWKAFILGTSAWIKIFSSYSFCRETCKIMTVFLLTTF